MRGANRHWIALGVAVAVVAGAAGCQKTLRGARCDCVEGWKCCKPTTDLCVLLEETCPGAPGAGGAPAETKSDASVTDGPASTELPPASDGASADASMTDGASPDAPAARPWPFDTASLPPVCTSDGWCWTNPLPTGEPLTGMSVQGPDDVWVVGRAGDVLRWDGHAWSTLPFPSFDLQAIWGTSDRDLWLGGSEGLWRWDGQTFAFVPPFGDSSSRLISAIWGANARDVWAGGGRLQHWDGAKWTLFNEYELLVGSIRALWGSSGRDVFAGALTASLTDRAILHFDGNDWGFSSSEGGADHLAGTSATDVWASSSNTFGHWDGSVWKPFGAAPPLALFAAGAQVGALGDDRRLSWWNGTTWQDAMPMAAPAPARFGVVAASASTDVWGAGPGGAVAHWDGTAWIPHLPVPSPATDTVKRIVGSSATDLWTAAGGTLLHSDGGAWTVALASADVGGQINDLCVVGPGDVWLVAADDRLHRRIGTTWSTLEVPLRGADPSSHMTAISGTADDDVWILRGNVLLHWDGGAWSGQTLDLQPVVAVNAVARGEVWIGGQGIERVRPNEYWSAPLPAAGTVSALVGSDPNDQWAVMGEKILHFDGKSWSISVSFDQPVTGLGAGTSSDAWAVLAPVDGRSTLAHWGGKQWAVSPGPAALRSVWVGADGTAVIGGDNGALLRRRP